MTRTKPPLLALATLLLATSAQAQSGEPDPKTLKERLSDKASDDQRVDNCRVPKEKQGTTPRPGCPTTPAAVTATKPP